MPSLWPWRKRYDQPTPEAVEEAIASSKEAARDAREATDAVRDLTDRITKMGETP